MNFFQSVLLGVIQGFTEFLPVSSSGHLVVVQKLMPNFSQPGVTFDVFVHAGTLFSILLFFRKNIIRLTKKYLLAIVLGSVPAVLVGLFLQDFIEAIFQNTKIVGFALIITALFNYFTDRFDVKDAKLNWQRAIYIGLAQALAIIPGISRSGSTIFAGTYLGMDKKTAAEFSFLLSVPAVAGANLLQLFDYGSDLKGVGVNYLGGFVAALAAGYLAINLVYKTLKQNRFKYFSIYLVVLAALVLIYL